MTNIMTVAEAQPKAVFERYTAAKNEMYAILAKHKLPEPVSVFMLDSMKYEIIRFTYVR